MPISRRNLLAGALATGAAASTGLLAGCSSGSGSAAASGASASASGGGSAFTVSGAELVPLQLFKSASFNDQALFAIGASSSQTAEVGEVLRICQGINAAAGNPTPAPTDAFDAYFDGFGKFADQLAGLASGQSAAHPVTARSRLMRASMYAAQQLFFVLGTSDGSREETTFDTVNQRWSQAIDLWAPKVVRFQVSSPFGPLPGYFFTPDSSGQRRPTVIISEGSDGQNVETMQFGVTAGLERGYNVALFEGPGQMSLLFKRRIPFTADWDKVVGPVLNWVKARPEVANVALIGISFGGMICARAAAKLAGLDAVVLQPAAWNMPNLWEDQKDMTTVKETHNLPAAEKADVAKQVNAGFVEAWPGLSREQQFTIYKRGEIFSQQVQQEAREGKPVSNYYGLLEAMLPFDFEADYNSITIPTMLTANEGDEFFEGQAEEAFKMLTKVGVANKVLEKFTAAQGAQLHDQPTGPQVVQEYVFDWLDDRLS